MLRAYKFVDDLDPETKEVLIQEGFSMKDVYVLLGEVEFSAHYVFFNLRTGRILPRMWHLYDFRPIDPEEEL